MCIFVREQSNFFNILDSPDLVYNVSWSDPPSAPSPPQHDLCSHMHPLSVITFGISAAYWTVGLVLCRQPQLQCVLSTLAMSCPEGSVSALLPISQLLLLSASFSMMLSEPWQHGGELIQMPHLEPSILQSLILIPLSVVNCCINCYKKKFVWY